MTDFPTLTAALDARAVTGAGVTFIDGADDERRLAFASLRERALARLGALREVGLERGAYLLLFLDDTARFVETYWAALYGGIVPVPVAAGATDAHLEKLFKVWRHLKSPRLVTEPRLLERLRAWAVENAEPGMDARLAGAAVSPDAAAAEPAEPAEIAPDDVAFIQFSSGSTGDPKGVVLTHANIATNIRAITEASGYRDDEVALSWMPLTHDMGLIGFHLTMLANGFEHSILRTDVFARRPLLWLQKVAEKRATLTCSPNFGYRHTLRAIAARGMPDVDLSCVRLIYNGAEPIAAGLARDFLDRMAPAGLSAGAMFTVYGLAEASLAVTFPEPGAGMTTTVVDRRRLGVGDRVDTAEPGEPDALELARLGRAIPDCEVRIAGEDGGEMAAGHIGRIQIRGVNVTAGYVDHPEANAAAFTADGWLDTGDLGFFDQGELVVTGRAKEIIFVNGQNYYPQDIEALACGADGVDLNKVVACGVRSRKETTDELVLFVLFRGSAEAFAPTARAVAGTVNRRAGVVVDRVLPVTHIPKTTSGKLQRGELANAYASGELDTVARELDALLSPGEAEPAPEASQADAPDDYRAAIASIVEAVVPDKRIGPDDDLFDAGLSSLDLAQIHEGIEERFPDRVELDDLFENPTILALAEHLARTEAA